MIVNRVTNMRWRSLSSGRCCVAAAVGRGLLLDDTTGFTPFLASHLQANLEFARQLTVISVPCFEKGSSLHLDSEACCPTHL